MLHESFHSPARLMPFLNTTAEVSFAVPEPVKTKLQYYSKEPTSPMDSLTTTQAITNLIKSEGKDPDDYEALFAALKKYEVVYPNMFLTEDPTAFNYCYRTDFKPKGVASHRLSQIAATMSAAFQEQGLDLDVNKYLQSALVGPFASILDISDHKPILVLNDLSYTSAQLFRSFSGVFCDATPTLEISKADFLEYAVFHEIAHKKTEEIIQSGPNNEFLPSLELGVDKDSISHTNLVESIADAFAVLKHMQRSSSDKLPKQIATMRSLSIFAQEHKTFATNFSLNHGGSASQRSEVEHYTTPSIDEAIRRAAPMLQDQSLQRMSDDALIKMAINIAREMKPSAKTLEELSALATSVTLNAHRYYRDDYIPTSKNSISPSVVEFVLDAIEKSGKFKPLGFYAAGGRITGASTSAFHAQSIAIDPTMKEIFTRYREATKYLDSTGLQPFTEEAINNNLRDVAKTIRLVANQTPHMTLGREMNDSMASRGKYHALGTNHVYTLPGVDQLLKQTGTEQEVIDTQLNERSSAYAYLTDGKPTALDAILQTYGTAPKSKPPPTTRFS